MSCHVRNGEILTVHSTHAVYKGRRYNLPDCALHDGSRLRINFVNTRHGVAHTSLSVSPPPPDFERVDRAVRRALDDNASLSEEVSTQEAQILELRELVAQLQTQKTPPTEVNLVPLWGVLVGWIFIAVILKIISLFSTSAEREVAKESRKKRDAAMVALNKRLGAVESILLGAPPESGSDN